MREPKQSQETNQLLRVVGDAPEGIYSPSDDSFLMLSAISQVPLEGKRVLDVGTGSGVLGLFCAMHGGRVTVTDLDESALQYARKAAEQLGLSLEAVLSDLFSEVRGQFDLILFNPPYLPSSTFVDKVVDGGPGGARLLKRFLAKFPRHLKPDGLALLLVSSLNDPDSVIRGHPEFEFSVMAKRSLFFEELRVLCVRFREDFAR